jgi:hypothetical protein
LGLDLDTIAKRALAARDASLADSAAENGSLRLAALLGAAARSGRDKLTLLTTPALRPLGYWIEQLVAESTGKSGTGIIPVEGEPLGPAHHYGSDRVYVSIVLEGEPDADLARLEAELGNAGAPCVRIELPDRDALAGEFYRWEVATAVLGSILEINPFDEPNVQESKQSTEAILASLEKSGSLPAEEPRARSEGVEIYAAERVWKELQAGAPSMASLEMVLHRFLELATPGGYLALLAYLERTAAAEASFSLLRRAVRNAVHVPVLQGYGPRYLHSIPAPLWGPTAGFSSRSPWPTRLTPWFPGRLPFDSLRLRRSAISPPRETREAGPLHLTRRLGRRRKRGGTGPQRWRTLGRWGRNHWPEERVANHPLGGAERVPAVHNVAPRDHNLLASPKSDRQSRRDPMVVLLPYSGDGRVRPDPGHAPGPVTLGVNAVVAESRSE